MRVYVGKRADGTVRKESFVAPDKPTAMAMAEEYRRRVRRLLADGWTVEMIPAPGDVAPKVETVGGLLDIWLDTCRAQDLSPTTLRNYKRYAEKSLLRGVAVSALSLPMIQQTVNARAKEKKSPKTIRNELAFLHAALRQSRPDLRFDAIRIPTAPRREISIPTEDEMKRILAAAKGTPLYLPICLAALMGLRRSEICGLKWADVSLKDRRIHVRAALVRGEEGYVSKGTKTTAGDRVLAIPSVLLPILRDARGLDRVTQLTPAAITCRYEELMDKLGLSGRFHDLRHFHASSMIAVGAPEKYIMADMGHASMDMVRRVYGHVMEDRQMVINDALDARMCTLFDQMDHEMDHDAEKTTQ